MPRDPPAQFWKESLKILSLFKREVRLSLSIVQLLYSILRELLISSHK